MARKDLITGGLLIYSVWIVGFRCNSIDIGDEGIGLTVKHGSDGFTHLDVSNLESQSKLGTISLKLMDNSNSNGHMSGNVNENLLNIFQSNSKPASTKIIRKTVVKSSKVPPGNEVYRFPNGGGYLNRGFNGLNSRTRARTNTLHIRNNRIAQRTSQSNQAPRLTRTMIQNSRTSSNVSQRNVPQRNLSHRVSNMFVNNKLTKNRKEQILSKKVTTNTRNDSYKPIYGAVKSITSNKTFKYNQHQQKHNLPFPTQISQYTTNNQYRTINYFTNNWIKITVHNIHLLRNPNVKIIKVGENIYVKAKTPAEKAKPTNNSNRVPIQPKSMPTPTINRKIPPKQNKIISRKMNNLDIIPKLDPVKNVVKKPHPRVKPSKISTKIVSTKTNRYIPRKVNNSVKILKKTQKTREPRKITVNTVTNPVKSFFIRTPSGKLIKVKTTGKTTHNRQASIPNEKTNTSTNSRRKNVVPSVKSMLVVLSE
ncbi:hypothetical protein LOTGIDRAFT_167097 [Lottia gigantea]|uniref:Uncharacterized protein n=1 Tax=Lottia gigantea TaxID=225164 RepID=V4BDG8_LOTGI|nr:hypothetical protein LOTGIDRAFT_167097 [Lottia gigantea]ESO86574.1 hypothetical protein LOTGIDRAFT_167097 [Lottia gigantea]